MDIVEALLTAWAHLKQAYEGLAADGDTDLAEAVLDLAEYTENVRLALLEREAVSIDAMFAEVGDVLARIEQKEGI